ncbi:MAG: ABC transporter ATP-binding protein [Gammaproteobacteria bacterium]|nr:ABC transporter ATP-binding protein [Gammaproteobacteria bacterium]MDH3464725.1 ABC transporter ATP-binding protein [Gammaproteobacteria bacterium]
MSLLEIKGLSKFFGGLHAVQNLEYTVESGKVHSIIGPNGAGKTTLFNIVTGVYPPSSGKAIFEAQDITGLPIHRLASLGLSRSFQNLQVFYNMTVMENVMVGRHRHCQKGFLQSLLHTPSITRSDEEARHQAAELLAWVGLEAYATAHANSLPYGALKRMEIARAMASEPKLLLLDEPAAGLNNKETQEIDELIRQISNRGVTVILVEHDMRLVMGVSDHILVMDHGQKLAEGSAEEIRENPNVIAAYLGSGA